MRALLAVEIQVSWKRAVAFDIHHLDEESAFICYDAEGVVGRFRHTDVKVRGILAFGDASTSVSAAEYQAKRWLKEGTV